MGAAEVGVQRVGQAGTQARNVDVSGLRHLVLLFIVGVDRLGLGYYTAKLLDRSSGSVAVVPRCATSGSAAAVGGSRGALPADPGGSPRRDALRRLAGRWVTFVMLPPDVKGHGRLWSHVASDASFKELHAFARALGFPERGFDRDHYDVPAQW